MLCQKLPGCGECFYELNAAGPPFLFEDVIEYSIEILARGLRQPVLGH